MSHAASELSAELDHVARSDADGLTRDWWCPRIRLVIADLARVTAELSGTGKALDHETFSGNLARKDAEAEREKALGMLMAVRADLALVTAELSEAQARHRRYMDGLEPPLRRVRQRRSSGEPAESDALAIQRVVDERDALAKEVTLLREASSKMVATIDRDTVLYHELAHPISKALECGWVVDDADMGTWGTGCGELFMLETGTPEYNKMRFCCYCGRHLSTVVEKVDRDDDLECPCCGDEGATPTKDGYWDGQPLTCGCPGLVCVEEDGEVWINNFDEPCGKCDKEKGNG